MTQESNPEQPLSQVVPMLTGPILCDLAAREPASGKWNLIGIFNQVNASAFPTQRPLSVYLKLSDAEGRYKLEIRYIQVSSGKQLAVASADVNIRDRLATQDLGVAFPKVPIPGPGKYEFQVWANESYLGAGGFTASSIARRRSERGEGDADE